MQRIVIPGEKLADTPIRIDNAIVENKMTYSAVLGMFDEQTKMLIPLEGLWYPRAGDMIVGVVEEDKFNAFVINMNSPYKGIIIAKFLDSPLEVGDVIEATVKELDRTKTAMLTRPRKLANGKLICVKPSKIPRIIGKANTMINQLTASTKTNMVVGLNGILWLSGGNTDLATEAILKIEEEAHTNGLTERIKELLEMGGGATTKV